MSEIFEGVLLPSERASFPADRGYGKPGLRLETQDLKDGLTAIYRSDTRSAAGFTPEMDELAAKVSMHGGRALLVRFDSRIGHRSSALFESGLRTRDFAEADELYVPLDDAGEPVGNGPRLRLSDLDPAEEYETIENAIQLGLRALGRGQWPEILRLLTTS